MSLRTLTEIADKQITRVIQTADGVGQVSMGGGRAREIHVVVDIQKLNAYGLSLSQVSDALVTENVEIPGGAIEQGKGQLLLRTLGRVDATEDFNGIVVATKNGTPIRVSDVGYAEDTFQRPMTAAWIGEAPAVVVDVRRAMGENTVAVIEGVRAKLETLQRTLPKAVKLTVIRDDSKFIYASVQSIEEEHVTPYEAAIQGTREVALAVMATTLSLVVIFVPIAFMTGYARRFINPFGLTMAFAVLVSMLVSFTLTPMLSSRFLKLSDAEADQKTKERGFFHWLDATYTRQVNWALDHPAMIIGASVVTFLMMFPLNRMVGREFVPVEDMGEWTIHLDMPEGTSLAGTTENGLQLLRELIGIEGVAQIVPSIGVVNPGEIGRAHV